MEDGDFIKCPYCDYRAASLSPHLKKEHQIDPKRAKELGIETVSRGYKERQSKSVSEAILRNPEERRRRSRLLGDLNKTSEFRDRASRTAIKTSARRDIQAQRADRLRTWRENNPEDFKNKCWGKMIKTTPFRMSKPERFLREWLEENFEQKFNYSQFLYSKEYKEIGSSSGRKQIDFIDTEREIYLEVDGPFHFEEFATRYHDSNEKFYKGLMKTIPKTKKKDEVTESIIRKRNKCLIRVSYSCWIDSTGRVKQNTLDKIREIIDRKQKGIFKLGREYGEDNCL